MVERLHSRVFHLESQKSDDIPGCESEEMLENESEKVLESEEDVVFVQ